MISTIPLLTVIADVFLDFVYNHNDLLTEQKKL